VSNETAQHCGPAILHDGLVNSPYVKDMGPFAELAESLKSRFQFAAVHNLSTGRSLNVKELSMKPVKNDGDFPVEVTYTKDGKEVTETVEALVETLVEDAEHVPELGLVHV
jgi:hypothetical protein